MPEIEAVVSLTGENSHSLKIPAGQGSFSMGTLGMNPKKFDILVDDNLPVRWEAFNGFSVPAGGHWPRFFYYYGNDCGFGKWSSTREIEDFYWHPSKSLKLDLSNGQIRRLAIAVEENSLEVVLGDKTNTLTLEKNIENICILNPKNDLSLALHPTVSRKKLTPYSIPKLKTLEQVTRLDIAVEPVGQPLDCRSLLQFKDVKYLNLRGNLINIDSLSGLTKLKSLGIRFSPNLENFPPFSSWKNLESFIAWNVEKNAGKHLRSELKLLSKEQKLDASISQLRDSIWFVTEYGIPFHSWEGKNAKTATKRYKGSVKSLKKAKTLAEIEQIIKDFVIVFNDLPQMETVEREDVATAVQQLIGVPPASVDEKLAIKWFDEVRDF